MPMRSKRRLKILFSVYVDRNAKTLLIKNLPGKVTEHELKEVFENAFQIRFLSNDGISKRYVSHLVLKRIHVYWIQT